jgi:7-carboxy-7-deazaguanine synthase
VRVTEIFFSIQGESTHAGKPCVFVRFTGCDLRCQYCDTAYAFHGGVDMTRAEILGRVAQYPARFVCLTGGEPSLQKELPQLAQELLDRGYEVSLETHGQRPLDALPAPSGGWCSFLQSMPYNCSNGVSTATTTTEV